MAATGERSRNPGTMPADPRETTNLRQGEPAVVERLLKPLNAWREEGHSVER